MEWTMKKLILFLIMVLSLGGCAQNSTNPYENQGLYYPMCYQPLQQARALDSTARNVAEGLGKGLLLGTLAGLAGGGVSALFTGDPMNLVSGMAIGAAGGAVAGGVTGGVDDHTAQKDALVAEWSQEAGRPLEGLGFNGAAATWAIQCYTTRLNELQKEVDEGLVQSYVAEPRLVEIERGRQEAYALLRSLGNN